MYPKIIEQVGSSVKIASGTINDTQIGVFQVEYET